MLDIFYLGTNPFELLDISRQMLDNFRDMLDKFQEILDKFQEIPDIPPIMLDLFSKKHLHDFIQIKNA